MKFKQILILFLFALSAQQFLRRIDEDVIYEKAPKLNEESKDEQSTDSQSNTNENLDIKKYPDIKEIEIRYKDKPLNIEPKIIKINQP
jgi:hypothetical protein